MSDPEIARVFGGPLRSDPAIALQLAQLRMPPGKTGPLPKIQFTIEFVGPRSIPAATATALLDDPWRQGLGDAEIYVMSAADSLWRKPQRPDPAGSYDSLALCWDYLSARGTLSMASATRLVQIAEAFGPAIQRRPMPMPTPDMVDAMARALVELRESLDIGFELGVISGVGLLSERGIWRACTRLGLELAANGAFTWRSAAWPMPLLSVASWDDGKSFSLAGAAAGVCHNAIGVGFNVPTSPDPEAVLAVCFYVGQLLADELEASVTSDEGVPYDTASRIEADSAMVAAIEALTRAGLSPGSAESLRLFRVE